MHYTELDTNFNKFPSLVRYDER